MNRQEINEIRKLFTKQNSRISRICGCYVTAEKEKRSELKEAFGSLPEEEMYKYLEIFKKVLSGPIGRSQINMEFPFDPDTGAAPEGESVLLALRDSQLKDEELLEAFYDRIIANYQHPENFLILLIHGAYDIPRKGTDGFEMADASDYVYHFVLCALCPVSLAKPALCYDGDKNTITSRIRDWVVGMPEIGFLYPAFNDRQPDVNALLYYTKDTENLHGELPDAFGLAIPDTAGAQKANFDELVQATLGEEASLDHIKGFHDALQEMAEERSEAPDPVTFTKEDLRSALEKSGLPEENLTRFSADFDKAMGDLREIPAVNVLSSRQFSVKMPDVTIKVNPDRTDLVETRVIDGVPCLVIVISDEVEVNGITLRKWE